jgi:hypothetical protein
MLPAIRGILPRTQRAFVTVGRMVIRRPAKVPSGKMPDGASRMLALPKSIFPHEHHHSKWPSDRSRE